MIESFHITNYRGFREFRIESLSRVNLITGANNVGKTALLEAFYLNLAPAAAFSANLNPPQRDMAGSLSLFRGFRNIGYGLDNISRWGWLFYGKDLSRGIELKSIHDPGTSQTVQMRWVTDHRGSLIPIDQKVPVDDLILHLVVNIVSLDGQTHSMQIERSGHLPLPSPSTVDQTPLRVLFGSSSRSPEEDAKWFSKLADVGRQDEVVETLRILEPRLKNLALSTSDGPALIYGDISVGRRVPISQMGDGMTRVLSLVLEISNAQGGVVLIDEIETGLHHSVLKKIWYAIAEAARRSDVQIVATTHSWECIRAAHEAFSDNKPYDFRLHRLDRLNGDIHAVTFNEKTIETSVDMNIEVR